jgi:hypothetical protein
MRKLAILAIAAAGAALVYAYFNRRAMVLARAGFSPPTNESVARGVYDALSRIVVDPDAVHVTVRECTVTLRGAIDRSRRDRALRAALAVPGVKAVLNRFDTDAPAPALDNEPAEIPPELRPN